MEKAKNKLWVSAKHLGWTDTKPSRTVCTMFEARKIYSNHVVPDDIPCELKEQWIVERFLEDHNVRGNIDGVIRFKEYRIYTINRE